jgi:excisionase family DNA binding protein
VDTDELLTVPEVAARLKVSEETVRRWLRDKRLRGRRLGSTRAGWRVAESELRRFLTEDPEGKARAV